MQFFKVGLCLYGKVIGELHVKRNYKNRDDISVLYKIYHAAHRFYLCFYIIFNQKRLDDGNINLSVYPVHDRI